MLLSIDNISLLQSIAERQSNVVKVRHSTVLCTGEPKAGKTRFCSLLMNKTTHSPGSGDYHTVFVKKHGENEWSEIDLEQLNKLIKQINQNQDVDHGEHTCIGTDKVLDILILLDINVPAPSICLLQPAIVTFVTYRLRGQEEAVCSKKSCKFIEELMSSNCFGKTQPKFDKLVVTGTDEKASYTAFIGTTFKDEGNSEDAYVKEVGMVNGYLNSLVRRINCSLHRFPLELWYADDANSYLHVVDLNKCDDEIVCFIKESVEKSLAENAAYKIPVSWVLLCFMIQRICYENKVQYISYNEVFGNIWKTECSMHSEPELNLALQFFHHQGVLFHFSEVEGVSDYVFTRCCWMFDELKGLLGKLNDKKRNHAAKQLLRKEGILNPKMIKEIEFEGPMTFKAFLNLLQHLKFIAPVHDKYFIPGVLESYESNNDRILEEYGKACYDPLLITFSFGSLHRSVFCFLSAHILANTPRGWELYCYDEQIGQQRTFKDMITFSIGVKEYICIIDKTFFLKIQIFTESGQCKPKLHAKIFRIIERALIAVCEHLEVPINSCKYGFICNNDRCKSDEHVMIVKNLSELKAVCCKSRNQLNLLESHIIWLEVCLDMFVLYIYISNPKTAQLQKKSVRPPRRPL